MTLEQKIKDTIEDLLNLGSDFLLGYSVPPLGLGFSQEKCKEKFYKIEKALEVIRELEKQLDRVRDTEKLSVIIYENYCRHITSQSKAVEALQNYILGGEGEKLDNK